MTDNQLLQAILAELVKQSSILTSMQADAAANLVQVKLLVAVVVVVFVIGVYRLGRHA